METGLFQIPDSCPRCGSLLSDEGSLLYCRNKSCPAKSSGSIKVWVDKLGLLYWGDSLIESLTSGDNPAVTDVSDLYGLSVDVIASHTSGIKYAKKCHDVLHSNKNIKLELLLSALNIPNLGISTATDMVMAGLDSIDKVCDASPIRIMQTPNIGEKTAVVIYNGIQDKVSVIRKLSGILAVSGPLDGRLSGKSFCITGSTSIPRNLLHKLILDNGGIVKETVVSGLSYLISNESTGSSKSQKAIKHGIPIITEDGLKGLIG